jgi:hypothetical protein
MINTPNIAKQVPGAAFLSVNREPAIFASTEVPFPGPASGQTPLQNKR